MSSTMCLSKKNRTMMTMMMMMMMMTTIDLSSSGSSSLVFFRIQSYRIKQKLQPSKQLLPTVLTLWTQRATFSVPMKLQLLYKKTSFPQSTLCTIMWQTLLSKPFPYTSLLCNPSLISLRRRSMIFLRVSLRKALPNFTSVFKKTCSSLLCDTQ